MLLQSVILLHEVVEVVRLNFYGTVAWQKARSVAQKRWKAANRPVVFAGKVAMGEKKA